MNASGIDANATLAERIIQLLRTGHCALDDAELAKELRVPHRQAVNQVCRRLVLAGVIHRYPGDKASW